MLSVYRARLGYTSWSLGADYLTRVLAMFSASLAPIWPIRVRPHDLTVSFYFVWPIKALAIVYFT